MVKYFLRFALIAFSGIIISCGNQEKAETEPKSETAVEFKGRSIDLKPYFEGFPYMGFMPFYKADKIYYFKEADTRQLLEVAMGDEVNLENGTLISDIDFSKRNTWSVKYNPEDGNLYWNGDEINDEVMNLYKLNPETKEVTKLTDVPYIFAWGWNKDKSTIAYIARLGTKDKRLGEIRVMNTETMEDIAIIQDKPEMRFTWGSLSFSPNSRYIAAPALTNADRNYGNIMLIDTQEKTWELITDSTVQKREVNPNTEWLNDEEFIYTSNESGYKNIFKYNISTKKTTQVTDFTLDIQSYEMVEIDSAKYIFAVTANPIEVKLYLIDVNTGAIQFEKVSDIEYTLIDSKDNKVIAQATNHSIKFRLDEFEVTKEGYKTKTVIDLPEELKSQIYNADVEAIEYPTFDTDPETGSARMIHAYLYKPKNPLPKEEQMVMIQSFYGGYNSYHERTQLLCNAGIYVLSPAPRGSSLFGKDFAGLNDKDLGGNEIIDVIYAAKFISEKLDIPSSRIGVYGGSHGGYATMRLLTFPGEINGTQAKFDWGFGLSHAGFSDIIHFYETCNIPDWVILEAGDPETEREKLLDRSPLYHADKMVGKLLLTHGTNDSRVPIEGSRWMADSLTKYGKNFELVEFEGQGHSIKGLQNNIEYYKTWFKFLESIE